MKALHLVLLSLLCFCWTISLAQEPALGKSLIFEERVFDFGFIDEGKGLVSHEFEFQNKDKKAVAITGVTSGCGCVKFDYPKQPISPGAKGVVKVYFNPAYRPGFFSKEIVVLTNDNQNYNRIWIKGTVNPTEHSVSDSYPYEYGDGLWMNFEVMAFGYMKEGDRKTMNLKFINNTDREMKLFFIVMDGNTDVTFTSPYTMKPKEEKVMPVAYCYTGKFSREASIYPVVDGKPLDKVLRVMCTEP